MVKIGPNEESQTKIIYGMLSFFGLVDVDIIYHASLEYFYHSLELREIDTSTFIHSSLNDSQEINLLLLD